MSDAKEVYIFDVDSTLADPAHRVHFIQRTGTKDWDGFFAACRNDKPIRHICGIVAALIAQHNSAPEICPGVIFISGRPEKFRAETEAWFSQFIIDKPVLYMRPNGDFRHDTLIKPKMLERIREDGYAPLSVFEGRDSTTRMWRAMGVPCVQVAAGDY